MSTKSLSLKLGAVAVALGGAMLIANAATSRADADTQSPIERGRYLVNAMGCADCHTPLVMGADGPELDMTRHLSGHPQDIKLPPAPTLPAGPWNVVASATVTAWNGPWGTSFTANLTPDKETGLGNWTADQFVETIRNQRHLGRGRPLLPPMPAKFFANLTDEDLRAIFAYLQTVPAVSNRVPEPLPPPDAQ